MIYGGLGAKSETRTARTTATTSLGHLLTRGSFYGASAHGAAPSRTSQWYSVDLGLIHFVVLDLNPGPPAAFSGAQVAWASADLAAADANRANVPWVVVTSHYPLHSPAFHSGEYEHASAEWYGAEEGEYERKGDGTPWTAMSHFEGCADNTTCTTVKDVVVQARSTLGALLDAHHVDIYAAGHVHSYSATWPIFGGLPTAKSFVNPKGTVHIVEGNGGVPGAHSHAKMLSCKEPSIFRACGIGMAYGRLATTNASVLTYEHVENDSGHVSDTFSIRKMSI